MKKYQYLINYTLISRSVLSTGGISSKLTPTNLALVYQTNVQIHMSLTEPKLTAPPSFTLQLINRNYQNLNFENLIL